METKNTIKHITNAFEKELEKANFKAGSLLFLKENKYFWTFKGVGCVVMLLTPEEDFGIGKEYFKPSFVNETLPHSVAYERVLKSNPILFIGFLETDVSIKIKLPDKSPKDENNFFIINKQNYNSFYDVSCEWNKSENYKKLVDELVENDFKYKILQFLYKDKIIWWSHSNLNKGIETLKEGFTSEMIVNE